MKYHLILNPSAGRGYAAKIQSVLFNRVEEQLGDVDFYTTEAPGDAKRIAASVSEFNQTVIVAGGDGTIHEVVNGLVGGNSTMGIIPIGSGNDFVKMLNLPFNYVDAIEVVKKRQTMAIDIGRAGEAYFPNGLGIGFDAKAVIESKKVKKLRGFLIYLYAVLKTILLYKNYQVSIYCDGQKEDRKIFMINAGNGAYLGGGFWISPKAELDDGLLEIGIIKNLSKWEIMIHLPKVIKGNHLDLEQVDYFRTTNLIVECDAGFPVHADGELISESCKKIEIDILPGALNVIHNLN